MKEVHICCSLWCCRATVQVVLDKADVTVVMVVIFFLCVVIGFGFSRVGLVWCEYTPPIKEECYRCRTL